MTLKERYNEAKNAELTVVGRGLIVFIIVSFLTNYTFTFINSPAVAETKEPIMILFLYIIALIIITGIYIAFIGFIFSVFSFLYDLIKWIIIGEINFENPIKRFIVIYKMFFGKYNNKWSFKWGK